MRIKSVEKCLKNAKNIPLWQRCYDSRGCGGWCQWNHQWNSNGLAVFYLLLVPGIYFVGIPLVTRDGRPLVEFLSQMIKSRVKSSPDVAMLCVSMTSQQHAQHCEVQHSRPITSHQTPEELMRAQLERMACVWNPSGGCDRGLVSYLQYYQPPHLGSPKGSTSHVHNTPS